MCGQLDTHGCPSSDLDLEGRRPGPTEGGDVSDDWPSISRLPIALELRKVVETPEPSMTTISTLTSNELALQRVAGQTRIHTNHSRSDWLLLLKWRQEDRLVSRTDAGGAARRGHVCVPRETHRRRYRGHQPHLPHLSPLGRQLVDELSARAVREGRPGAEVIGEEIERQIAAAAGASSEGTFAGSTQTRTTTSASSSKSASWL